MNRRFIMMMMMIIIRIIIIIIMLLLLLLLLFLLLLLLLSLLLRHIERNLYAFYELNGGIFDVFLIFRSNLCCVAMYTLTSSASWLNLTACHLK